MTFSGTQGVGNAGPVFLKTNRIESFIFAVYRLFACVSWWEITQERFGGATPIDDCRNCDALRFSGELAAHASAIVWAVVRSCVKQIGRQSGYRSEPADGTAGHAEAGYRYCFTW
jgi:hypothetical protein